MILSSSTISLFNGLAFGFLVCQSLNRDSKIIEQVIALDIKRGKALKNNDYDFLEKLYAADWTYVNPWGRLVHKQEYLDYLKKIDYQKLEYSDYQGRLYGNTAILTLINQAKAQSPDGLIDEKLYYTRIYVKKDDQWTFVAQQGTVIKQLT